MKIEKMTATITDVTDLSPTAREVRLSLPRPLPFIPGAFINVFFTVDGEKIRRAYSISSDPSTADELTLSIRNVHGGKAGQFFWDNHVIGSTVEIQGPLGLNTIDKMDHSHAFLFGFGIGVSVIKSIAHALAKNPRLQKITIMTGNRNEDETIYKTFFEKLTKQHPHITFSYVLSHPHDPDSHTRVGHVQDHIGGLSFDDADVYLCGQEEACNELLGAIMERAPHNTALFVEAFH